MRGSRFEELDSEEDKDIEIRNSQVITQETRIDLDTEVSSFQDETYNGDISKFKFANLICKIKEKLSSKDVVIPLILLLLFNIFYMVSLRGCAYSPATIEMCAKWLQKNAVSLIVSCSFSCIWLTIYILIIYYDLTGKVWNLIGLVNVLIVGILDSGINYVNHGLFNLSILIFGVCLSITAYIGLRFVVLMCRKGWRYIAITSIAILCLFFLFYFYFISGSCDEWEKGIGNTRLTNLEGECKIIKPNYCELSIIDGWFNINKFTQECKDYKMVVRKEDLNEKLQNFLSLKRIGYPRVEDYPNKAKYDDKYLAKIIPNDFINMDDPEISQDMKDNIEFILDVSNNSSHILYVELKKNQTRAEEAKKLRTKILEDDKVKEIDERIDKDVLIFYIDNISRPNFHRKLKGLSKWLNQYADEIEINEVLESNKLSNQNNKTKGMMAFEYFKFHSLANFTLANNNGLFYGENGQLLHESSYLLRHFKDNGYIVGHFSDECMIEEILWETENQFNEPFTRLDHLAVSLACDSNHDLTKKINIIPDSGVNTIFRKCMYGKSMHEIQLDYITQFWEAYPENRKAFRTRFLDAHEVTGENIKYNDKDFVKFFENFKDKGYLYNTIVYFIADHGQHFVVGHVPFLPDDSRYEENYLPLFIALVPADIPSKNLRF